VWAVDANLPRKALTQKEAEAFMRKLNKRKYCGYSTWRLPTADEVEQSFDFVYYKKNMEQANLRLSQRIGVRNLKRGYYLTSKANIVAVKGAHLVTDWRPNGETNYEKLDMLKWATAAWPDKGYVWPVTNGK
jgi:hypothetical protein